MAVVSLLIPFGGNQAADGGAPGFLEGHLKIVAPKPVEVAEAFTVSVSWIYKALGRRRTTGETTARPQRCHVPGKLDLHHDEIRARVAAVPDMTIAELRDWLWTSHGIVVGHAVMWETLKRLGLSLKNVWPAPSARMNSHGVLVCINVSGHRA